MHDPAEPPIEDPPKTSRRTTLMLIAGVLAAGSAGWVLQRRSLPPTQPLSAAPGFRRLETGTVTRAFDPFIGLATPGETRTLPEPAIARVEADICDALYPGGWSADAVPLAVFTDYNCPICRRSEAVIKAAVDDANGGLALFWHELPLLGPSSVAAARGALAAKELGAYDAFRTRLMRTRFEATDSYLTELAAGLDVDPARLLALSKSAEVDASIANALGLAHLLQLPGTPSLVVGRTVVVGAVTRQQLTRLIAQEQRDGLAGLCRI